MSDNLKNKLQIVLLVAIETIFCFTPLGTIPIGPIAATLMMVPVIITALTFGVVYGSILGFVSGLYSFLYWTFVMPAYPTAFLFTPFSEFTTYKGNFGSIIICFIPRILAGLLPALYIKQVNADKKFDLKNDLIATGIGSFTNTILVLLFIFIFFRNEYETILGQSILSILLITLATNGVAECIICMIICPIIVKVLRKL